MVRRTIILGSRKTSISLEESFWTSLKQIAREKNCSANTLVNKIAREKQVTNLSAEVRCFVIEFYLAKLALETKASGRSGLAGGR